MKSVVRSVGAIFASGKFPAACEPDNAPQLFGKPARDFILCRDAEGNATAVYGEEVWDFNPCRLSAKKISPIAFNKIFGEDGSEQRALIEEAKYVLYCLIYFAGGGRIGLMGVSTLQRYWYVLRLAMQFCHAQKQKRMVGVLSLQQLFTVPVYLDSFLQQATFRKTILSGIFLKLIAVGEDRLGYAVVNPKEFDLTVAGHKQHPVIPTRIYLRLINVTGDLLEQLYPSLDRIESFIKCFSDEHYGITISTQRRLGRQDNYRPDLLQALKEHGLVEVFSGEFSCRKKLNLQRVLVDIQYLLKVVIHLYTGMRDQEVLRMSYCCLSEQVVREAVVDDQGVERDNLQVVNVLSTTTKFAGYKKEGAWLAPSEVIKAIKVAQAICRGLAKLYKIELNDRCPLFLKSSILHSEKNNVEVGVPEYRARDWNKSALRSTLIRAEDMQELAQSDPSRDFYKEPEFAVGQPWPLTSHQFRRSLAFYGSSSGFLSLPTLRTQFKHMTIQMSRYYANNYENLRTIFGYYDENKKDFVLPSNHFAFEFQMAMPMSVANQLIADLLFNEEPLFGGTGSYMEKQKKRINAGEIQIEDVRTDTEQRVKSGSISYRPTLLGGCTKVGRCDSFMLGDYTECLSCEGAIIKPDKLNMAIVDATNELCNYAEDSGEYQIVNGDIERLASFKSRLVDKVDI